MRIITPQEPIAPRQMTVLIYGQPGARKTSLAQTCDSPVSLDYDGGIHRAFARKDCLSPGPWPETIEAEKQGLFAPYKTLVVDTVGSCQASITAELIRQNPKNGNRMGGLSLPGWGALKSTWVQWTGQQRQAGRDIVLLAHEVTDKDGDSVYHRPDIAGGSYGETMRICDLVGYLHYRDGKRWLTFAPSDQWMAKGPPDLGTMELPDFSVSNQFLGVLIERAKSMMGQAAAVSAVIAAEINAWRDRILDWTTPEEFTASLGAGANLDPIVKLQVRAIILDVARERGFRWSGEAKKFVGGAA